MTPEDLKSLADSLLSEVRNYLDVTWDDEDLDKKLKGIIARGINRLNNVAGTELDYTLEDSPKEILFEYCRYARSNALEEFEKNFVADLNFLRMREEVKNYGSTE